MRLSNALGRLRTPRGPGVSSRIFQEENLGARTKESFNMKERPFWKTKSLREMTRDEWESLCDGCGICCLEKVEDEETGEITLTSVSCEFLDTVNCRCLIYEHRLHLNPDCVELSVDNLKYLEWLPDTCAYKSLFQGRKLAGWHPLVSGDPSMVHEAGVSVRDRVLPGRCVHPEDIRGKRN
jgi:uncharacterized cysteine cluster protein YcgN (CxxCxxCC family)